MKKTISILVLIFAIVSMSMAQGQHEGSVYLGGGMSYLSGDISSGNINSKFGPLVGLGYTYKLNSEWGLVSGLEFAIYQSDAKSSSMKDKYMTKDNYDNDFEFRFTLNNFKENMKGTYLNIPIMVQFNPANNDKFYANLGVKVGIPLSGKYRSDYSELAATGYYPATDVEYGEDIEFRGFGKFGGAISKGKLDMGVAFMVAAECGMKWKLPNAMSIYAGGYLDYGLNNIVKGNRDSKIIRYDKYNPTYFQYNSILESEYTDGKITKSYVEKVVPLAFGLKVRLGFSL